MKISEAGTFMRRAGGLIRMFRFLISAFLFGMICAYALGQEEHSHPATQMQSIEQKQSDAGTLIKIVRESTERFKDVRVAEREGYALMFGCVTGPDVGAMGLHYVNGNILATNELDPARPQVAIY